MQVMTIDKSKCRPEHCENGICVATYTCTWRVLEQEKPYALPAVDLKRCLGCARCTFTCPLGAVQVAG